jgi:hypothetical protein
MAEEIDFFAEDHGRYYRFQQEFKAQNLLGDLINEVFDQYNSQLTIREGEERDLSILVVAAVFGKAQKTFQTITRLCALGYGEDAIVLLRSNINLLINIGFILTDTNPVERAKEFIAYGLQERIKYINLAHGGKLPEWMKNINIEENREKAEKWRKLSIEARAKQLPTLHYTEGYRLYSSLEHADVMELNEYIYKDDDGELLINSAPSDAYLYIALVHNFCVMADFFINVLNYFNIQRLDIVEKIQATWRSLDRDSNSPLGKAS